MIDRARHSGTRWSLAAIPLLVALLALAFVSHADALTQRPLKETFGPAAKPSVGLVSGVAIDRTTDDVLIADSSGNTIRRFHADGTPAPFAALGTNAIDGAEANGKTCAEEPASCDQTPQNGIRVPQGSPSQFQIAIDESGGITDGDIYLTQRTPPVVDVFSGEGRYLGQLTEAGVHEWVGDPEGVAVDPSGAVYVSNSQKQISKFVPTQNPVVNTDLTANIPVPEGGGGASFLAFGAGPAEGTLFGAYEALECMETVQGPSCGGVDSIVQLDPETGELISQFDKGHIAGPREVKGWVAVNPVNGNVLDGSGREFEVPDGAPPVKVSRLIPKEEVRGGLVVNASNEVIVGEGFSPSTISVYGQPATVPAVTTEPATEVGGTRATLAGTVNPQGLEVTKCVFQYGETNEFGGIQNLQEVPCEGDWETATDSTPHPVHATATGLQSAGHGYKFRLIAYNENGQEETEYEPFTTAHTVATEPASPIGQTSATLNGLVRPEGEPYTACFFEYGLAKSRSYEKTAPCTPGFSAIPADFAAHEVKTAISGLQSGVSYRYRVVATDGAFGTLKGEDEFFSTLGVPRIVEAQASNASQGSVTLEARINPNGFGTSYRFEWGQTLAYGNVAPVEFEPFIGSGTEPILVKTTISGLAAGSAYHYRVTASSSRGTIHSPDHVAETLNSCGLPEGRCYELVSRREAGPVAIPGEGNAHIEMHFQAATGGPGGLAYEVESGYPEATKGAEVVYRAQRGPNEWESRQLSTPINAPDERNDGASVSDAIEWLSNELSCGFVESVYPLTPDPAMRLVIEEGGSNLYRINPDGSYTPISTLPPKNAKGVSGLFNYAVAGGSQNCDVTAFSSAFEYPGIPTSPGVGEGRLYEWRDGTLRNAGLVPGPVGGEVSVPASAGHPEVSWSNTQNTVSEDGSRLFFTAVRQTSSNPAEIGKKGVFVREDGRETRDVSLSETATPDEEAVYQWATADGSKVFFTANAGLTAESNGAGTDLYEYDLETEELTDRSVTPAEGGAQVSGFLGASADGSVVYFASSNQLLPGEGNSRAQNLAAKSLSIYGARAGESGQPAEIAFGGTFNERDRAHVLIENQSEWTSQVSHDGRYLLFESSAAVTGYENHNMREGYLFDADSQETICVTCRQDGQPSTGERYGRPAYEVFARGEGVWNPLHGPRFLAERNGEALVFFNSPDPLAPGAVGGQNNIYEWSHNQIFRLTSAPDGSQALPLGGYVALFAGASDDGSDVYLTTPETLNWEDGDARFSAYDARIGGGYPRLPEPPARCEAMSEGKNTCMGPSQGVVGTPGPATTGDAGTQNFEPKKKSAHNKHKKKKRKGKSKSKKKKAKGKKSKRQANGDRRNGK